MYTIHRMSSNDIVDKVTYELNINGYIGCLSSLWST